MFNFFSKSLLVILLSGLSYYFSMGFYFQWYLLWLAPIPLLIYCYQEKFWPSVLIIFLVGLAPGINGLIGYKNFLPLLPLLLGSVIQSIEWTLVVLLSRFLVLNNLSRKFSWLSVLAFPVTQALFEWLQSLTSDGTFNSFSDSQLPFLPIMQIASLTGFFGVTFIVSLFGSCIAYAWVCYQSKFKKINYKKDILISSLISAVLILGSLIYGYVRLDQLRTASISAPHIMIGMAAKGAPPKMIYNPEDANHFIETYQPSIQTLAKQGARLVLLPEESLTVNTQTRPEIFKKLSQIAANNHVDLIIGVNEFVSTIQGLKRFNAAWLFNQQGDFVGEYQKRHFVPGVENGITPGINLLNFDLNGQKEGIAICRDMDYVNPAAQYGKNKTQVLLVPAWDFDVDAAVHVQGALVRGIENGYTLVRNARNGFMTVTSETGELLGQNSSVGIIPKPAVLLINTPVETQPSFYSQHEYWFVWLLGILLGCLLIQAVPVRLFKN